MIHAAHVIDRIEQTSGYTWTQYGNDKVIIRRRIKLSG